MVRVGVRVEVGVGLVVVVVVVVAVEVVVVVVVAVEVVVGVGVAMTLIKKYKAIQKIGTVIEVPHSVWTKFSEQQRCISIAGTDISLGEDYCSLDQAREAVAWFVEQLGGKVKWEAKDENTASRMGD